VQGDSSGGAYTILGICHKSDLKLKRKFLHLENGEMDK
jgi:hypothetical protein